MIKNYVIGAGGHCRSVLRQLILKFPKESIKIVDFNDNNDEDSIMGVYFCNKNDFMSINYKEKINCYCAIGNNKKRISILKEMRSLGFKTPNLISKNSTLDESSCIGKGCFISDFVYLGPQVKIGNDCIINTNSIVEHETIIENGSHVAPSATICGRCFIGERSFIGANSTIIEKINISPASIIGAGSVVIKDIVIEGKTWVGVPANLNDQS
tara:strand:+ start:180 stop:815 length:636 start_codon:yes stop_codon:yes gene_type:complete